MRIDKWLWAARFYKTRGLAQEAIAQGRVRVAGERVKTARVLKVGETLTVRVGDDERTVRVCGLSAQRGPAPVARALYEESAESLAAREAALERRRQAAEPAWTIEGRPTKRDRRALDRARGEA
jgi:ribosome-associated heat shock protein Hsp15